MKFISFVFFLSLIFFDSFSQIRSQSDIRKQPLDIVECFLIMPSEKNWEIPGEVYNLFVDRQEILKTTGERKVLVDKKNGYLKINDNVNGLDFKLETCYFIKADKTKTLAASYYQAGGDCDSWLLKFYNYSNQKWVDVTKTALPLVSLKDFGISDKDFIPVDFIYQVPQFGTSIYVTAGFPCELDERMRGRAYMKDFDKYKKWALKKLELKWNKEKGVFEKGALK